MATSDERPVFDPRPRESYLRPIPEVIADVIPLHARRAAVLNAATSLTYADLGDYAARIAHAMLEAGVRRHDRAVLLFDHRPQALAAMLGVLQGGAIAVPLTASTPLARRDLVMRDAEPACVVTDIANEHEARALAPQRLPVITLERLPPAPPRRWPALHVSDPALIVYTSGSTGQPKGVVQSHRSIMHKVWATAQKFSTTPDDRITMFSTYAVGQGMTASMSALVCGATVCQFDVRRLGLERLAKWLEDERISIYISSATLFRALARAAAGELRCPDLRLIRLGSERVTVEDVSACRKLFAQARLLIAYSSTETANVAMHFIGDHEDFPWGIVPAGLPTDRVSVAIVDDAGQPLAPGQEGEIVVRSAYLPSGYWRDPERTARTYLTVAGAGGERQCRTGDVGRIRPDGCLEILGRKDRRVKVRGFRIELDEIEALLATHPSVARAAVLARPDHRGDPMLVAYLEMSAALETPIEEVRSFALARLPDHMVPTTFVVVEIMPVGDLGTVDRSRLPDPPRERPSMSAEYVPPRTPLERTIGGIWQEVLGHAAIGVHDPFLMVGGDSLRAAQIASRLSSALDLDVPLWELLEASTVANLAEIIAGKQAVVHNDAE
jgi:amino acid adenylation domain-containing protein